MLTDRLLALLYNMKPADSFNCQKDAVILKTRFVTLYNLLTQSAPSSPTSRLSRTGFVSDLRRRAKWPTFVFRTMSQLVAISASQLLFQDKSSRVGGIIDDIHRLDRGYLKSVHDLGADTAQVKPALGNLRR